MDQMGRETKETHGWAVRVASSRPRPNQGTTESIVVIKRDRYVLYVIFEEAQKTAQPSLRINSRARWIS